MASADGVSDPSSTLPSDATAATASIAWRQIRPSERV
jgi:hypothetical protein